MSQVNAGTGNIGVIVTASLAGLLFGFDTVVIAGVTDSIRKVFQLVPGSFWDGFAVASGLVGTFLGALFAGPPGDRYGSRDALKAVGAMYIVSALGCAFCWNLESFYVFRFIGGLAIGASSVLAPVYISEIAPADRRGRLTGLFQFNIVLGIVIAFTSNALVQQFVGGADPWRLKLGIAAIPALVFFVMMYTIPQSPRWLAQRGRHDEAKASLARVGVQDSDAMLAEFPPSCRRALSPESGPSLLSRLCSCPVLCCSASAMTSSAMSICGGGYGRDTGRASGDAPFCVHRRRG